MIRLTTAQAIIKFLDNQYILKDGKKNKFVDGFFTIFGHGIAVGLGQALNMKGHNLKVYQGRNEQGMCHVATSFAKQNNRKKIIACTSSIGPGAANMVTAAATATVNNIPLLLFPADTFASRQPDPVLQQLEVSHDLSITTNDAFKPVCKYWDRIQRPEQIMTALINAMRVLTDPSETGAVCISLCQDVEGEAYDFPEYFFEKRIHRITRIVPIKEELEDLSELILNSDRPLAIIGGGVKYSEAGKEVMEFLEKYNIPFGETQAGKSAIKSSSPMCLGGIGVTGTSAANKIAKKADLIISIGSRMSDFTTSSKSLFNDDARFASINVNKFHAYKLDAQYVIADAKLAIKDLDKILDAKEYLTNYNTEIKELKHEWDIELKRLSKLQYNGEDFEPTIKNRDPRTIEEFIGLTNGIITQTSAISKIREVIEENANIITAGGSLPSCLQRMWKTDKIDGYHAEYGYSCMGYEVSAALGVKMADEENEVYAFVGDGSFQMMHSEMATIIQENKKVNILLFDNCGFGCINNLEMVNGIDSIATEFRKREEKYYKPNGDLILTDYKKIAEGFGFKAYRANTLEELEFALNDSKKQDKAVLIDIKVLPKTMTDGYDAWWNVGMAEVSDKKSEQKAWEEVKIGRKKSRKY